MTETAGPAEAQRLDELAAVTKEYAKYSGSAGFANVAAGLGLAAAGVVRRQSADWGAIALVFVPLVYLELLPVARAYYQRRGEVLASENAPGLRTIYLVMVLGYSVMAAINLMGQVRWAMEGGPSRYFALGAAGLAVALVAARVRSGTRATIDSAHVVVLLVFAVASVSASRTSWFFSHLGFAAFLTTLGAYQHRAFRRLERRLAGLRSPAA